MFKKYLAYLILPTAMFLSACSASARVAYAPFPPPPLRVEVMGVSPGPDYIWCDGYWDWENNAYIWIPGRWALRPFAGAIWFRGGWYHHTFHRGYHFHPGHFEHPHFTRHR